MSVRRHFDSWISRMRFSDTGQAVFLLLVVWLILCRPWWLEGLTVPWDSKAAFYPSLYFVVESLRSGDMPWWNPYIYGGYPMVSDPQSMIYSPLALLLMLIPKQPTPHWFDIMELLHILLGGLGMLLLCVRFGWSAVAGLYAALVYMFGGSAAARMEHVPMILAYSYFPFAMLTLKETFDTNRARWAVAFGVVAGLMAAHQNQVAYLFSLALTGYVVYLAISAESLAEFVRTRWRILTLAASITLLVQAVPLYSTLQFLPFSNRKQIPYEVAVTGSLHPLTFLTLFVRDFFDNSLSRYYWGFRDITESYLYIGILPIVLVFRYGIPSGLLFNRQFRLFLAIGIFGVLYSLGSFTPFYWLAYHLLPGVDLYRRPTDAAFVINMVLALATGFLINNLLSGSRPKLKLLPVVGQTLVLTGLFIWGVLYARQKQQLGDVMEDTWLALLLAAIAWGLLHAIAVSTTPQTRIRLAWVGLVLLVIDLGLYNIGSELNAQDVDTSTLLVDGPAGKDPTTQFLSEGLDLQHQAGGPYRAEITMVDSLWANAPMMLGIHSTQGYNPLRYAFYTSAAGAGEMGNMGRAFPPMMPGYDAPLLDLLSVKYIASVEDLTTIDPNVDQKRFPLVFNQGGINVWENPGVLPRILTATAVHLEQDLRGAITEGRMASVDYRTTVVLEHLPQTLSGIAPTEDSTFPLPGQGKVSVRLLIYRNTEVVVAVRSERDTIVVLNDLYYPYWRVYVDGQQQELLQANYLFRGVHVKAGDHRVAFRFEPFSWSAFKGTVAQLLGRAE